MAPMVGMKLRETRLAQKRPLADVAAKASISVATLSRVETDKQSIDLGLFLTLARVLGIAPAELLAPSEEQHGTAPLARRIVQLGSRKRLELWQTLASEARQARPARRPTAADVSHQVEELLAQIEFLREELQAMRKQVRKR